MSLERRYWSRLEMKFQHFIRDLPHECQAALDNWVDTLLKTARRAFEEAANNIGDPTRGLKAATLARGTLEWGLAKAIETQPQLKQD